jgi:hypothetical protein
MMKKMMIIFLCVGIFFGSKLSAQDTLSNGKALNFPTKKFGISIGNSIAFNGIRLNFADIYVKKINGLNLTLWMHKYKNENAVVNGISFGFLPIAGKMQGINIGILGTGTSPQNLNGLSFGGIAIGSGGNINGLAVSGLLIMSDSENSCISGLAISGLGIGAKHRLNGIFLAGFAVATDGNIYGISSSLAYICAKQNYTGIALTPGYFNSDILKGLVIAAYTKTKQTFGLSIGLYNRTQELQGVQIGLLNHAGNNPRGLRNLPLINLHFGKI